MLKKVKDKIKSAFTWVKEKLTKKVVGILTMIGVIGVMGLGSAIINAPQNDKITNGLVGCWTMNGGETTSTTLTDCSGNGYDGALTGSPSPVIGRVGQAIDLNGTSQYATMTGTDKFTSTYTKTAWIKVPSNATSFAGNILSSSGGNITVFWALNGVLSAGHAENLSIVSDPAGVLPADTWFHVAVTFDNGSMKLYKDGVEIDSATGVSTPSTTSILQLGAYASANNFKGQIDDARVYNRALTANEIYRLYNTKHTLNSEQNDKLTSGLVGYWTMNGADTNWGTNTITDVSSKGNNGTLTSMSTTTSPAIGVSGQALYFANSPTIAIPSSADFAYGTGDFTWSMWVNANALSGNDYIIDHGSNGGTVAYQGQFIYYNTTVGVKGSGATTGTGEWKHVVARRAGGTTYIYVDGVEETSFADSHNYGTQSVTIGNYGGGGAYAWDGNIDEVRLYNRALSTDEISRLYKMNNVAHQTNTPQTYKLTNGLIAYYTMNGPDVSTSEIKDVTGNNHTATTTGIAVGIGRSGQAIDLDGVDDYATTESFSIYPSNETTMSAWVKGDAQTLKMIFSVQDTAAGPGKTNSYISTGNSDNTKLRFWVVDGSSNFIALESTATAFDGEWHHVVATFTSAGVATLYVDGVASGTSTNASVNTTGSTANHVIGARGQTKEAFFDGLIDELRVYNRALSQAEITKLYNLGK